MHQWNAMYYLRFNSNITSPLNVIKLLSFKNRVFLHLYFPNTVHMFLLLHLQHFLIYISSWCQGQKLIMFQQGFSFSFLMGFVSSASEISSTYLHLKIYYFFLSTSIMYCLSLFFYSIYSSFSETYISELKDRN